MSGGAEGMGWDPKMKETVGASVIIEGCLAEDLVDQDVEWSVPFHDPLGKEE